MAVPAAKANAPPIKESSVDDKLDGGVLRLTIQKNWDSPPRKAVTK